MKTEFLIYFPLGIVVLTVIIYWAMREPKNKPLYRAKPIKGGRVQLEEYVGPLAPWHEIGEFDSQEEADEMVKHLESGILYYYKEKAGETLKCPEGKSIFYFRSEA